MPNKYLTIATTLGLLGHSLATPASLSNYTGAEGAGLVYSSENNVTWTQDANLLGTLETSLGFSNAVNAIIAASPAVNDLANAHDTPANSGHYTVTASDFYANGKVSWFGAKAFVGYLNSITYGGSNQWRLPTINELGRLFYTELNGTVGGGIPNTTHFINEQAYAYFSDTDYAQNFTEAWIFVTQLGFPNHYDKLNQNYAWAVSPGQVSAVPVPSAAWLMGGGLLWFVGNRRRR
ncbi:DUF1566 domain-containing protein (plasmid) [Methylomonas sp. MS20]|uniref:Lcl domain-containing protein n=1 Tax=Methylomonas sp. MS20 TaxID=3418769 RepID=UPI003D02CD9B